MNDPLLILTALQQQLDAFRAGQWALGRFVEASRPVPHSLLNALPPAFSDVWHNLLDRLESSALFAEESCSFSQKDLIDSLQLWLNKARQRLQAPAGT
jgi:hypothetical protein